VCGTGISRLGAFCFFCFTDAPERAHPSPAGGNLFDLAGEFYIPSRQQPLSDKSEHNAVHARSGITSPNYPRWFFRTLRPAREDFDQKINSGDVAEGVFNPQALAR